MFFLIKIKKKVKVQMDTNQSTSWGRQLNWVELKFSIGDTDNTAKKSSFEIETASIFKIYINSWLIP